MHHLKQVWLADDATGAGNLIQLRKWWDIIIDYGSRIGYYVNQEKSWLIIKDERKVSAKNVFFDTGINFTTEGRRHLGAAIGSNDFRVKYATEKVKEWCSELKQLSKFALSQPQAAYAAFYHGEQHKFSYFTRTIPCME